MATQSNAPPPRPTYQELITDQTLWDMNDIAVGLDVQYQTVKSWRRDQTAAARARSNQPHPNLLPPAAVVKSGKPLWQAGSVRLWAMQTGRMTNEGMPKRSKPRGRPRGSSSKAGAAARAAA